MAADIPSGIGIEGVIAGAQLLSRPADEFGNDPTLEAVWVIKATEHMEVYFNLLCSLDPKLLKLTPHDDKIYSEFKKEFPDFPLDVICEERLKSVESKEKWRPFCEKFANIVEDYNFGTLVRLDCSDEYSEKNTILVLRIQFYAIEIARNREGLNDGVRNKFKPTARNQRTQCTGCFLSFFWSTVEDIFDKICKKYNFPQVSARQIMRREDGSEEKGEFSMLFNAPHIIKLLPFLQQISAEFSKELEFLQLSKCKAVSGKGIYFSLNRLSAFSFTLLEVSNTKNKFGANSSGTGRTVVVSMYHTNDDSVDHPAVIRSNMIANHVAALLAANGFKVHLHCNLVLSMHKPELLSNQVQLITCSDYCDVDNWCNVLEKRSKESKWLITDNICQVLCHRTSTKCKSDFSPFDMQEEIILDSKKYLDECIESQSKKKYLKQFSRIYVRKDGLTKSLKRAAELEHILCDHLNEVPFGIVYVCSEKQEYRMQSSALLLEMLSEKNATNQIHITHTIGNTNQEEITMNDIYRRRKKEMQAALVHKYGPKVLDHESWLRCIDTLTETAVKFDFLSFTSSPVKLIFEESDKSQRNHEKKRGTFVQYNCARLAMLFKRHQEMVNEGKYNPLPPIEKVDFGLLKLQEEWDLLFNYVMPFPQVVKSVVEALCNSSLRAQCPSREICRFLMTLSQDLSLYYNRTRILGEAMPHLQQIMAARIWLLRSVHQVMKNTLALLGVEALEQM